MSVTRFAIFFAAALASCREAPSTSIVVLPRAISLNANEAREIEGLNYSPHDIALGWRGDDSLIVGHVEAYAYADVEVRTCTGTGLFAVPFTDGGAARPVRVGPSICDALRGGGVALLADASVIVYSELMPINRSRLMLLPLRDTVARPISGSCVPYAEEPAVSLDGLLLAIKGLCAAPAQTEWGVYMGSIRGDGWRRIVGGDSVSAVMPSWSPDARSLVVRLGDATDSMHARRLAVVDVASGAIRPLVPGSWPRWSPSGEWIAFVQTDSVSSDDSEIRLLRPDGSEARVLFRNQARTTYVRGFGPIREGTVRAPILWTRDSRGVVFGRAFERGTSLWFMSLAGGEPRQLTDAAQR